MELVGPFPFYGCQQRWKAALALAMFQQQLHHLAFAHAAAEIVVDISKVIEAELLQFFVTEPFEEELADSGCIIIHVILDLKSPVELSGWSLSHYTQFWNAAEKQL